MAAISSDENPGIIEAALRWFWTVWEVLRVIRFSAALTIIFSIVIIMVDQAHEVLVALADRENFVWRLLLLMATGILFSLNAWYWARIALYASPPQLCDPAEWGRVLERYLPRLLTLLPFIALVIAVARILVQTGRAPDAVREKLLYLAAAAVTGVLVFACTLLHHRLFGPDELRRRAPGGLDRVLRLDELPVTMGMALRLFVAAGLLFLAIFILIPDRAGRLFGPASLFMLWAGGFIGVGSLLLYFSARTRIPWISTLIVLAVIFSLVNWNDNHAVRRLDASAPAPLGIDVAFDRWLSARLAAESDRGAAARPYPVIIVAAEGGGARAGYWTGTVLATMQDLCPQFAQHVFAISGVSGGSVGASVFAASLARNGGRLTDEPCRTGPAGNGPHQEIVDRFFAQDLLSPLLAGALFPDLLQRFLPAAIGGLDRARAFEHGLEGAWDNALHEAVAGTAGGTAGAGLFSGPLAGLWGAPETTAVPYLFLNATNVETGWRSIVSPISLPDHTRVPGSSITEVIDLSGHAGTIPLSAAAHLSARFPYLSPAGDIVHRQEAGRYVDGGYFDNSGMLTAMEIAEEIRVGNHADRVRVILLYIPSEVPSGAATERRGLPGLGELLSPVRTLLSTRTQRGTEETVRFVEAWQRAQSGGSDRGMVQFRLSRSDGAILSLGWLLSGASRQSMAAELRGCDGPNAANTGPNCATMLQLLRDLGPVRTAASLP